MQRLPGARHDAGKRISSALTINRPLPLVEAVLCAAALALALALCSTAQQCEEGDPLDPYPYVMDVEVIPPVVNETVEHVEIRVLFNTKMNPSCNPPVCYYPTTTFAPDIFDDGFLVYSSIPQNWDLNDTRYTITYKVAKDGEVGYVDVVVKGGQSATGKDPYPGDCLHTEYQALYFDTIPPTLSVSTSRSVITGSNASGTLEVYADFSEPMNPAITPLVSFKPSTPDCLLYKNAGWNADSSRYTWTYDVVNTETDDDEFEVVVTGGKDLAENPISALAQALLSIDTAPPDAYNVVPHSLYVSVENIVSGTFALSVLFDDAMDISISPTVTFPTPGENPTIGPTGILSHSNAGYWDLTYASEPKEYVVIFDVADVAIQAGVPWYDVRVASAKDSSGNLQTPRTHVDVFSVDTVAPTYKPQPPDLIDAYDSGDPTDNITNVSPLRFQGTVDPSLYVVYLYAAGDFCGADYPDSSSGHWEAGAAGLYGPEEIRAQIRDEANNGGPMSDPLSIHVDTLGPWVDVYPCDCVLAALEPGHVNAATTWYNAHAYAKVSDITGLLPWGASPSAPAEASLRTVVQQALLTSSLASQVFTFTATDTATNKRDITATLYIATPNYPVSTILQDPTVNVCAFIPALPPDFGTPEWLFRERFRFRIFLVP